MIGPVYQNLSVFQMEVELVVGSEADFRHLQLPPAVAALLPEKTVSLPEQPMKALDVGLVSQRKPHATEGLLVWQAEIAPQAKMAVATIGVKESNHAEVQ